MVKLNRDVTKRVFVSVDWGFTNPGVMLVWAVDGDERMYLVHQIYRTRKTIDWWRERARELNVHYRPECFVCDPSEPAYITQLRGVGAHVIPANNEIRLGIEKVQERLKIQDDGRPRLFVVEDSLLEIDEDLEARRHPYCVEDEFSVYAYPEGKDGKAVKEEPIKVYDHGMDAVRYAVAYLDATAQSLTVQPQSVNLFGARNSRKEGSSRGRR